MLKNQRGRPKKKKRGRQKKEKLDKEVSLQLYKEISAVDSPFARVTDLNSPGAVSNRRGKEVFNRLKNIPIGLS